ncbi:putative signal peptide protein [Halorubrum sp. AJ67]|nr:putative signal peptide protein [Halorubrum sp. AJ67]
MVSWLATFFARTCPASSIAKPACMKKMRKQTTATHMRFTPSARTLGSIEASTALVTRRSPLLNARPIQNASCSDSCVESRLDSRERLYINVRVGFHKKYS